MNDNSVTQRKLTNVVLDYDNLTEITTIIIVLYTLCIIITIVISIVINPFLI